MCPAGDVFVVSAGGVANATVDFTALQQVTHQATNCWILCLHAVVSTSN